MKLLFVYNANSGKINSALDIAHKLISPKTYQCNLCTLTHGTFKERDEWASFKQSNLAEMRFLHKDEFEKDFPQAVAYPIILRLSDEQKNTLSTFMDSAEINSLRDSTALIQRITDKIDADSQSPS